METHRPDPPSDWVQKSGALLADHYSPMQHAVRERLGLPDACGADEIERVIVEQLDGPDSGDDIWLSYPKPGGAVGQVNFRRGYRTEAITAHSQPVGEAVLEQDEHPLAELADNAKTLVYHTRCTEPEAVAFLLADEPFVLPWLEVETETGPFGPRFTIRIGTIDVSGERLAAEYTEAVNASLGIRKGGRRRRPTAHAYELWQFVNDTRSRGITDREAWEEWKARPGVTPYESVRSFRNRYKVAKRMIERYMEGEGEDG